MIRASAILILLNAGYVHAAEVVDATGRSINVPDGIQRVVPAGPSGVVVLLAVAPDRMVGWPSPISNTTRAIIVPDAGKLPRIPCLTGAEDVTDKVRAPMPDVIICHGNATDRHAALAKVARARTGIPMVLRDGPHLAVRRQSTRSSTVMC